MPTLETPQLATVRSAETRRSGRTAGWIRRSRWPRWTGDDRAIAVALFVGFLLVRLPFRAEFLVNWDAVNFALGVSDRFDIQHHQPHPPGYIGYVGVGRALTWLTGEANAALTLMSVIAGAVVPASFHLLARRFVDRRAALTSALLFGTAPLVWYYSVVALTYVVAAAVIVPLAWACHVARTERSSRHLLAAGVLLAALGAFRQIDMVLLAPVWLYAAAAVPPRGRRLAALVTGALTLLWLVPLLWLAGGPLTYLQLSADLAEHAGGRTWIFSLDPAGLLHNLSFVALGTIAGLFLGLVPLLRSLRSGRGRSPLVPASPTDRRFLLLWALPALAVYLLLHTGQLGYVLVILPIGYVFVALAVADRQRAQAANASTPGTAAVTTRSSTSKARAPTACWSFRRRSTTWPSPTPSCRSGSRWATLPPPGAGGGQERFRPRVREAGVVDRRPGQRPGRRSPRPDHQAGGPSAGANARRQRRRLSRDHRRRLRLAPGGRGGGGLTAGRDAPGGGRGGDVGGRRTW